MSLIGTLLSAVSNRLTNVAGTTLTLRDLGSGLVAPHRYVWEPTTVDDATDTMAYRNQNPKLVSTDRFNFTVHCWGATYDDAQQMRQALRQALKNELGARGKFDFGQAQWSWPEWAKSGYVLSQNIGLYIASVEINLPASALDYPALLETNTYTTVTISGWSHLTPTSTDGDSILELGES